MGMLPPNGDLGKVDSMYREMLWDLQQLPKVTTRIADLLRGLYSETECSDVCKGICSLFPLNMGVKQGCILGLPPLKNMYGLSFR